jgi:hypothetical protein
MELWELREEGKFSIHGLEGCDSKLGALVGILSYQEFIAFVNELPFSPNQGSGELDRYNQVAAALIHLRTGVSWLFLSFLFFNSPSKQYDLSNTCIRALTFIEETIYHQYVFFPPPEQIEDDTLLSLLTDIPGCYGFVDGTYLYGESSYSANLHAAQYCHYKGDSQLSKFLVFCSPTGFIMGVYGPFSAKSDDTLFKKTILAARERTEVPSGDDFHDLSAKMLTSWLDSLPSDGCLAFDSGFPDAASVLPVHSVHPIAKRKDEKHIQAETAIMNRRVTRHRGVVERVNRRLKVFRLLTQRFPNISLMNSELFFHVAAILSNRYCNSLVALGEREEKSFKNYFN